MEFVRRHIVLLLLVLTGGVLVALPQIDLAVAGAFYDPAAGFYLKNQPLVRFVYDIVPWISRAVLAALLLFLVLAWSACRTHPFFRTQRKAAAYLLLVALLGPLLLVNGVFKEHWGRARPAQIEQFGGNRQFTRAAVPTDQCERNCSFVSGHASTGFFFLAPAFVYIRRRRLWLATGTLAGLGVGAVRILQGGHFLSDVVFSGIVVYLSAVTLHALMYRQRREAPA